MRFQPRGWARVHRKISISKETENKADWEEYLPFNLEPVEISDGEIIVD